MPMLKPFRMQNVPRGTIYEPTRPADRFSQMHKREKKAK